MTRLRALALGAAVGLASAAGVARADALTATRAQALVEVSHDVHLELGAGVATYTVRRTFANSGEQADEARLDIRLPPGAAATGLRIRARDRWFRADLLPAEEAAEKYRELTGLGVAQPKDPAILFWRWADRLGLQVFPVFPHGASTVEYTLTAPIHYERGRYIVSYPHAQDAPDSDTKLALPVLHVDPGHGDATTAVWIDGQRVAPRAPIVLKPAPPLPWVGNDAPDASASYVTSAVDVAEPGQAGWADVDVAIDHTYAGDLRIELVTPAGDVVHVTRGAGGDNDVRGRHGVALPAGTEARGRWHLRVSDHAGLDVGTLERFALALSKAPPKPAAKDATRPVKTTAKDASKDARKDARKDTTRPRAKPDFRPVVATDVPIFIPDAPRGDEVQGLARVEIEAPSGPALAGHYGRVRVRDDLSFARLQVLTPPQLSQLPRRASVVFVLDASRSVRRLDPQLATLRAYLEHLPDAQVEVVVFRRVAERLTGSFNTPATLLSAVASAEKAGRLALGNGSALEHGLRAAGEALRGRAGPRRIVLLTDARLRSRFTNDLAFEALRAAPRDAIAHVALPDYDGYDLLERDDRHDLAAIPRRTGGVLFQVHIDEEGKGLAAALLGMVRPVSVDNVALRGFQRDDDIDDAPERLVEGDSFGFMSALARAPRQVTITGELWSRPVRRTLSTRRDYERATAAFVFSEDEFHELSDDEQLRLAMFGRAVSPVTSYLAVEPGVRPSTIGFETIGLGTTGLIGRGGGGGTGSGYERIRPTPLSKLMATGVAACVARHAPPAGWRVEVAVETTYREVVDVIGSGAAEDIRACIVEVAWSLDLPDNYTRERHTYHASFS